jgi:hypothetical protein
MSRRRNPRKSRHPYIRRCLAPEAYGTKGREPLVDRVEHAGWSPTQAAEAAGVNDRTEAKWLAR